jgi:hypothetical protein
MENRIEVPFDTFHKYCKKCMYRKELLNPAEYFAASSMLEDREHVRIELTCSARVPCTLTGDFKATIPIHLGLTMHEQALSKERARHKQEVLDSLPNTRENQARM